MTKAERLIKTGIEGSGHCGKLERWWEKRKRERERKPKTQQGKKWESEPASQRVHGCRGEKHTRYYRSKNERTVIKGCSCLPDSLSLFLSLCLCPVSLVLCVWVSVRQKICAVTGLFLQHNSCAKHQRLSITFRRSHPSAKLVSLSLSDLNKHVIVFGSGRIY